MIVGSQSALLKYSVVDLQLMKMNKSSSQQNENLLKSLLLIRNELSLKLGQNEPEYQALMREWFSGRLTKMQLDENVKVVLSNENMQLHNIFVIKLFRVCQKMSRQVDQDFRRNQRSPNCDQICGDVTSGSNSPAANQEHQRFDDVRIRISRENENNAKFDLMVATADQFYEETPQPKKAKISSDSPACLESVTCDDFESTSSCENEEKFYLRRSESWRDEVLPRLPTFSSHRSDAVYQSQLKNECMGHEVSQTQTEGLVGRLYVGLWEHGLDTVTHDCVLLIFK